jgi:PAS domain S-box-containing protein
MAEVSRSRTLAPGARQPWYRRPRLQFTAQAVLLLAIVLGMVSQVVSSRREAEELLHVNGVAADLVRLSGDLWDVETGARRYVLTGRDAWLAPYHAAVRDIDERTGHLRTLTQDDPVTAGALAHFTAAKDRELQRIARLVEVRRRQGADAALAAVRTGVGNEEMDALLRDLDGILAHWRDRRAVLAIGLADGQARLAGIVAFGAALGIVLLVWSYRTQQRATNALRQSSNEKQAILDGLVEGVSKQAADGRVVTANARAPEILGLTEDQLLGRDSHDPRWGCVREDGTPYPGDEHPPMIALRTGRPVFDVTLGIDKPDGSRRWLRVNSVPLFEDGAAAPVAVVSSFLDITDERAAGQALRDSQSRLQTILDSVPAPITYWDAHRICLFANQAAMDWYAPAGGQVVGRETAEVIGDRADAASETFRLRALAGERCDFERIDHDAAGEARNVVVNYIPHVADGEVRGLFALVTDTTELSPRGGGADEGARAGQRGAPEVPARQGRIPRQCVARDAHAAARDPVLPRARAEATRRRAGREDRALPRQRRRECRAPLGLRGGRAAADPAGGRRSGVRAVEAAPARHRRGRAAAARCAARRTRPAHRGHRGPRGTP